MALIHTAMLAAMRDISEKGIYKTQQAVLGGAKVNYRGIESAMNEMSGVLIRNGIRIEVAYSDPQVVERVRGDPADGKYTRIVVVRGAFTFIAEDDSRVQFTCYGEAADSMDKAFTKAQSVAFRTALFQQFVVPYMAIDPEAESPEEEDEFAPIYNGIESKTTEDELRAYWKEHVRAFKPNTKEYTKFRRMIEQRRAALSPKEAA